MVKTFQLKLEEELNRVVLAEAAKRGINKHDFVIAAIKAKLASDRAV